MNYLFLFFNTVVIAGNCNYIMHHCNVSDIFSLNLLKDIIKLNFSTLPWYDMQVLFTKIY